ncbi:hypothetical protein CR513_28096 [Mucuna pruriens]|uniref:Uncharacterized protein n=1 Tax=Mucuna pruriens TaxID=157652 RepID=A0A371GIE4_MUCPR|nr:hypothetical protein CR513_28096 [Mucuna pruriens]
MDRSTQSDHSGDEVLVTDLAIGADIDFPDPLVELGGFEFLANVGEDVAEFGDGDEAGGVLVEDFKGVA